MGFVPHESPQRLLECALRRMENEMNGRFEELIEKLRQANAAHADASARFIRAGADLAAADQAEASARGAVIALEREMLAYVREQTGGGK